ncbi:MAG: ferredoxin [Candidatus Diapherotrites archaeon]|nr:ferredoxin [Candidatus Micrarchaeota archaeon]MBU1939467.1 ferredoxin [Candidatus Micrarchaeota archaeon]
MAVKIEQDIEKCIGCGSCAAICPENWVMNGDKSKPKKTELDDIGCNKRAADACPVQCIKVVEG